MTDIGGKAASTGPFIVSIEAIVLVKPDGRAMTKIARTQDPAGHGARVAPVVVPIGALMPDDELQGKAHVDHVPVGGDVDLLQVVAKEAASASRHVG